ncbi:hypothetical protein Tco_0818135 [Tanacetum coccineum]
MAKQTKPSMRLERARKTEAEGVPIFYRPTRAYFNRPEDLEQIHEDDLEAMNLKWQLSLQRNEGKRGNVEHQGTKMVSSDIKTTLGRKETMKTHIQKAMLAIDVLVLTGVNIAEEQSSDKHGSNGSLQTLSVHNDNLALKLV